jgi:hypothetical protein
MHCQLEFFADDKSEFDCLRNDMKDVKESSDKVRKSLFARHGELARKYIELHERMQIIERNICTRTTTSS